MDQSTLCVSIPLELQSYKKTSKISFISKNYDVKQNFGIKIIKKPDGKVNYTAHYTDSGELFKKCYYEDNDIVKISHFRSDKLFCTEDYESEKLKRKTFFTNDGEIKSEIFYEYSGSNIKSIKKLQTKTLYEVIYGYDELDRINKRTIKINDETVSEQRYKFDILDRLLEYQDSNQKIEILRMSPKNQLIYYKITDKIGNNISVTNNFDSGRYKYTEISLNGHKMTISDINYVDNIMLKKPYATEDDLDLIIANLFSSNSIECSVTKRPNVMDMASQLIQDNIQLRTLPISIRKRILYNMSLNAS